MRNNVEKIVVLYKSNERIHYNYNTIFIYVINYKKIILEEFPPCLMGILESCNPTEKKNS